MIKQLNRQERLIALFTALYVLGFAVYFAVRMNTEFLWYVLVLVFFFALVLITLRKTEFPPLVLWGLSIWGLLHMAGGGIPAGDSVLYAAPLIPIAGSGELFILKYDQFVHTLGFFVATLVVWHLYKPHLAARANTLIVYVGIALAGMGLGAVNEIVEFIAVLAVPDTGVGGYANTALDLVFNTVGATAAAVCAYVYDWRGLKKRVTATPY